MLPERLHGFLLDVDYRTDENQSHIRLFVRTPTGIRVLEDPNFHPYYAIELENAADVQRVTEAAQRENKRIRKIEHKPRQNNPNTYDISFYKVEDLVAFRQTSKSLGVVKNQFEDNIVFAKRYLIDTGLVPFAGIEIETKNNAIQNASTTGEILSPTMLTFDLETLSPDRFPDPKKDPILMIGERRTENTRILTYAHESPLDYVHNLANEREMIETFIADFVQDRPDLVITYNGDSFDIPYLAERAHKHKIECRLHADGSEYPPPRGDKNGPAKIRGTQHLDAYQMTRLLARLTIIDPLKFDLESVIETVWGVRKDKVAPADINRIWQTGENMDRLFDYNRLDAHYTHELAIKYLPVLVELGKLTHLTVFDICRETASGIVETFLIRESQKANLLVPNPPSSIESAQRLQTTYEGGYVREPESGLHENIAVLDFSSLHPSIMISHNISPETADCAHAECKEKNTSPNGHWFCRQKKGFLSSILTELFNRRIALKKKLKQRDAEKNAQAPDQNADDAKTGRAQSAPHTPAERPKSHDAQTRQKTDAATSQKTINEHALLTARVQALKIILNSFYGYLGYDRSRWYSAECASAVTAWSRTYVQWVGEKAEKAGYRVIYGDTDSEFLVIPPDKSETDVRAFVDELNKELPGVMQLDLEGVYARGIFVTKDSGEGAKKKYALMKKDGRLKIVGFEYVRRDWSTIAKETQKDVLTAVLGEGNPKKALAIVRERITALKGGKIPKKELVVYTQLRRNISKYESVGPHVAAAKKAIARGKDLTTGSVLGFIITRKGETISDKAELEEYVNEGDYDADYYIENQVVPAVIKVMREFGYTKEDLIQGGKQTGLNAFT